MFPVRYELNSYILFKNDSVLKELISVPSTRSWIRECMHCTLLDRLRAPILRNSLDHVLRGWLNASGLGYGLTLDRIVAMCRRAITNYFQHGNQTLTRSRNLYVVEVICFQLHWWPADMIGDCAQKKGISYSQQETIDVIVTWSRKLRSWKYWLVMKLSWPRFTWVSPTHTKWIRPN
jgi:hypothetical protein